MTVKREKGTGRPSAFSPELGDAICERIGGGESLRAICRSEGMPHVATVCRWLAKEENEVFREQYARAREAQADVLFDEILDIADNGSNDWMQSHDPDNPGWRQNGEAIRRSQLRIDARKWMAGKLRPKKYGDTTRLEHAGGEGKPLEVDTLAFARKVAFLLAVAADSSKQEGEADAPPV